MSDLLLSGSTVQHLLVTLGYSQGPAHGDLREETWRAVLKRFQADSGLGVDGWYGTKSDVVCRRLMDQLKAAPKELKQCRRWRVTNYYVANEGEHVGPLVPILTPAGIALGHLSAGDFASAALEGTIKMKDGRILNVTGDRVKAPPNAYKPVFDIAMRNKWIPDKPGYAGLVLDRTATQVVAVSAFSVVPENTLGDGYGTIRGMPMKPYRTLAADIGAYPRNSEPMFYGRGGVCPPGTEMFIAEFVGKTCPDGHGNTFVHDGWFVVNDTGGGIFGAHVDMFAGSKTMSNQVSHPTICHVWFRGATSAGHAYTSETRIPFTYGYGL